MWTVYEIYDLFGNILYVGETTSTKDRFYHHRKTRFPNQQILMHEVAYFNNRKDARSLEEELKIQYGFPITERTTVKKSNALRQSLQLLKTTENYKKWAAANGTKQCTIIRTCPRCKRTGKVPKFQNHIEKGIKSCKL